MQQDEFFEAEKWAERMIANNPENALGYSHKLEIIINVYGELKRAEEVLKNAKKIVTMEKFRLTDYEYLFHYYKRDYNIALTLNEIIGDRSNRFWNQACLLRLLNRNIEAEVYFDSLRIEYLNFFKDRPDAIGGYHTFNLALAYSGIVDKAKSLDEIAKLKSDFMGTNAFAAAQLYILLGDNESAIKILEKGVKKQGGPWPGQLKLNPLLDPLRSDPRFKKIIAAAEERIKKAQQ